jgi:hypothetical protein
LVLAGSEPGADPLLGKVIDGRYEVRAILGEGGMGTVYRVKHIALERELALKALKPDLAGEPQLAERFLREAQSAAAVNHPGICEITDFGLLPGSRPYFVMELLTGKPLSHYIKQQQLTVQQAVHIAEQLARALDAAHQVGVVHRDLKPDNILLEGSGSERRVKIVDFGLARVVGQSRLTRPGLVYGTPHYMSPEQAAGESVDHRADIYALGVVVYEMLTGHVPFEADTYMGVLTKHMYATAAPLTEAVGDNSLDKLEHVILRCIAKNADDRYQRMSQMADDLLEMGFEPTSTFPCALPRSPHAFKPSLAAESGTRRPATRPPTKWLFAGGGLLLLAGAAARWLYVEPIATETRARDELAGGSVAHGRRLPRPGGGALAGASPAGVGTLADDSAVSQKVEFGHGSATGLVAQPLARPTIGVSLTPGAPVAQPANESNQARASAREQAVPSAGPSIAPKQDPAQRERGRSVSKSSPIPPASPRAPDKFKAVEIVNPWSD